MFCLLMMFFFQTEDTTYNLRDFRLPDAGVMRLYVDGGFSVRGKDDQYEDLGYNRHYRDIDGSTQGFMAWELDLLGEQRYFDAKISPGVRGYYDHNIIEISDTSYPSGIAERFSQGSFLIIDSRGGWYLGETPFLIGYQEGFRIDQQIRFSTFQEDTFLFVEDTSFLTFRAYVYLDVGFGKLRNVSPAANAWLFLDELRAASYNHIETLGKHLAKRWSYQLKHWRYDKFFYSDAEELLLGKDILPDVSAYDIMRLKEIIAGLPSDRIYGARFTAGVGYRLLDRPAVRAELKAGYPLSSRLQFNLQASTVLEFPGWNDLEYNTYASSIVAYYIGEQWAISSSLEVAFRNDLYYDADLDERRLYMSTVPVGVTLYLDDRFDLGVGLIYSFEWNQRVPYDYLHKNQSLGLDASITWRLR